MQDPQNLGRVNRIKKGVILLFCATCCLLFVSKYAVDILRRSSLSHQDTQGFHLDNKNVLFDGIGEFDYLRGEPPKHNKQTTSFNASWKVNAQKSDVETLSGTLNLQYTIDHVETKSTLNYLHCNTRDSFINTLKARAFVQDVNPSLLSSSIPLPFSASRAEGSPGEGQYPLYEILLLHDKKHLANDWSDSGILHELCINGLGAFLHHDSGTKNGQEDKQNWPYVSVTAIDLDPNASGLHLYYALRNLEKSGIVSGKPMVVVSPAESGKTVISLGAYASEWLSPDVEDSAAETFVNNRVLKQNQENENSEVPSLHKRRRLQTTLDSYHTGALLLTHVVKVWITISSIDVLESSPESLRAFLLANIDVLSIHQNGDIVGKRASERLEEAAGAQSMGIDGDYMQNHESVVRIISNFLF